MSNEHFEMLINLFKFFGWVVGGSSTVIIPLWKYFEYKEVQARETSLGETKAKVFEKAIAEFSSSMLVIVTRVDKLTDKYDELIEKITDKFLDSK